MITLYYFDYENKDSFEFQIKYKDKNFLFLFWLENWAIQAFSIEEISKCRIIKNIPKFDCDYSEYTNEQWAKIIKRELWLEYKDLIKFFENKLETFYLWIKEQKKESFIKNNEFINN